MNDFRISRYRRTRHTNATAKRWYDKWIDEIKRSLESRLLPSLEASVKRMGKKKRPTR